MNDNETSSIDDRSARRPWAILRWLLVVVFIFGAITLVMTLISKSPSVASPLTADVATDGEAESYPAPDFRLASLGGEEISPQDYLGDVVVVEFWATWCGPCRLQARFLEELGAEFADSEVRFLAVNSGEDQETVQKYVDKTPFPYPVLLDPEDMLSSKYRIIGLPTVMIVNREGSISFLETGLRDVPTLRQAVIAAGATAPSS